MRTGQKRKLAFARRVCLSRGVDKFSNNMGKSKSRSEKKKAKKAREDAIKPQNRSSLSEKEPREPLYTSSPNSPPPTGKLSSLQAAFKRKLDGARFRQINEMLYSTRSGQSFAKFQGDPKLFDIYHEGFREQTRAWPHNPLDTIIQWIRFSHPKAVVVDMGCGDARLAAELTDPSSSSSSRNVVHSFDLVSRSPLVTACDIRHVPLADASTDIVVFCLALMVSL